MQRHKSDHPTKNCTIEGCERPLRAKGRCGTHYNQMYRPGRPNRHEMKLFSCAWCGKEVLRSTGGGRKYGATCSNQCRQWLATPYCKLPADHWARWYGKSSRWQAPKRVLVIRCAWCEAEHETYQTTAQYCSRACGRRASKARRRAKEAAAEGEYTWSQVIRLHLLAEKRCSYCDVQVAQPEPDHVVPISRGGRNDIGNILPCCQRCNGDKGDMTLTEWADYREQRGKTLVRTAFDHQDQRFKHLVMGEAIGRSHRIQTEFERAA